MKSDFIVNKLEQRDALESAGLTKSKTVVFVRELNAGYVMGDDDRWYLVENSPDAITVSKVRQILMNELGLSKKFIAEMVGTIVRGQIDGIISTEEFKSKVDRLVVNEINHHVDVYGGSNALKDYIGDKVDEIMKNEIMKNLSVDIKLSSSIKPE